MPDDVMERAKALRIAVTELADQNCCIDDQGAEKLVRLVEKANAVALVKERIDEAEWILTNTMAPRTAEVVGALVRARQRDLRRQLEDVGHD